MAEAKADDGKQVENKSQAAASGSAEERLARLESENAALLKETLSKKEQIRAMESAKTEEEQKLLKEQNKYKELYEGSLAKAKRAEELEPVFNQLLDAEVALIPEDKRDLVPAFDKPEQKLLWLQKAKTQGVFGIQKAANEGKTPPAKTVQSKVNTDGTLPEFVSWDRNDQRITSLSTSDYQIWKRHNTKIATGVAGWGNARN